MRPRSIVLDLYGDYVRYDGGALPLSRLSALLAAFGVGEDTSRVVLSRMRREGWFTTSRNGRSVTYTMTRQLERVLDEGRERIFTRRSGPWDGSWHLVMYQVPEAARASRERLRSQLAWLGYGPLAPSTYLSPHDRSDRVSLLFAGEPDARVDQLTATSRSAERDRDMAQRGWDLPALAEHYRGWTAAWQPGETDVLRGRTSDALVLRTELVQTYRRFPFSDPDLPAELQPAGWPGTAAHALFRRLYDALEQPARARYDALASDGAGVPA